jgi:hypothetical protein
MREDVNIMISFVNLMRTFHNKVILDDEYLANCYAPDDQAHNNGWLTLIQKKFLRFGHKLVTVIYTGVRWEDWDGKGNDVILSALSSLVENTRQFRKAICWGAALEHQMYVLESLIKKALHAISGSEQDKYQERAFACHI